MNAFHVLDFFSRNSMTKLSPRFHGANLAPQPTSSSYRSDEAKNNVTTSLYVMHCMKEPVKAEINFHETLDSHETAQTCHIMSHIT